MPHERIVGVETTFTSEDGKTGWTGVPVVDVYWGKDQQSAQVGLSLMQDGDAGQLTPLPTGHLATIGSWTQINLLIRVLKRVRNDAFGTPE